ncbi:MULTISPECIES: ABC transporter permease [Dietzia]|uniref:ABC transporter permease n=1 Tax=Dietzia maris TaxID=37915 RepID=A0ABT8GZT8_9ACTN|nr:MULTISPECIES: ABC transporter permease [Dietzia]MBB0990575.1 ABC transporter permease [Dietzia sp. SLG510A3-30A2]ODQ84172.1 ABC transporter permease [Dietzia alimentaria]MBB0996626.1 ABC transporter permease [Dietzia maris]MBB1017579.1 ABC transporter permease [Dietzia sp. DQ11-71]MCY1658408.1 ABC transporter permease [Dietzia sp. SL131]
MIVQPLLIVAAAVGVLWWAFSGELEETQKASLNAASITQRTLEHVQITVTVVAIVVAVGVPLGILLTRRRTRFLAPVAVGFANIGQAAPAIGLIVLLFLATNRTGFWIGVLPVAFYSLLPVLRNTIVGIRNVDPALIDAARGQGMSSGRVLRTVELPLAVPFILAGLRTTLVLAVGTATLSFLVDAGGLGIFIDTGYRLQDYTTLVVGSVLAVCLALFVDWLGGVGEILFNPKGLR